MSGPNNDIIARAEEYFYFDDQLTDKLTTWAEDHCDLFSIENQEEHPFEHQLYHQEFCQLFELIMESFLSNEGISMKDFYGAISSERAKGIRNEGFTSMLLSVLDFGNFCNMMLDVKMGRGVIFCPPLVSIDNDLQMNCTADSKYNEEIGDCKFSEKGEVSRYKDYK